MSLQPKAPGSPTLLTVPRATRKHPKQRVLHHRVTQLMLNEPEKLIHNGPDSAVFSDWRPRTNSSPSEMRERRLRSSVRREQYYGSVELVVSVDPRGRIRNIGRFRLEPSSDYHAGAEGQFPTSSTIIVENPQEETRWYWKYFLGNEHQNFSGIDPSTKSPFFLSITVEEEIDDNRLLRAILWTAKGPRRLCVPVPPSGKPLTAKAILQRFPDFSDHNRGLKEILNAKVQKELVVLEDQEGSVNCKFGVIFSKSEQSTDSQMLSNEFGDEGFEKLLRILGQRIELQNWGSYRGGLDITTNSTGRESVYAVFAGHEIMFHVSTLLPYSRENEQQVERKRHVGNDIVNIVFETGGDPVRPNFSPTMMKSHFTHVFAVVTYEEKGGIWRLWVFSEESVPAFGPSIPYPNTFTDTAEFREFLLTKLINAEKAAYQAKVFVEKRHRTNDTLLKDMYMEYLKECQRGFNKVTDSVIRHIRSPVRKEAPRESVDFCKLGELIKLEKTLSGDVNETVRMTSICRKQPWDKEVIIRDIISFEDVSVDAWGHAAVVTVTKDGAVQLIAEGKTSILIEPGASVQQIAIVEHFGLFIARMDKGRDGYLGVFSLSEMRHAIQTGQPINKKTAQSHKIPSTKGCHLFARSEGTGLRLNIVACIGKKMLLLRWALGPLGRYTETTHIINNFTLLTVYTLPDEPSSCCVYEMKNFQSHVKVIALANKHIHMVDLTEESSESIPVPHFKGNVEIRSASDGDSDEFVLMTNSSTLLFDKIDQRWTHEQTFWSTTLHNFVFRFPFIIGFGEDLIEIRLAVNGNLLATMYMPNVRLITSKTDIIFSVERAFSGGCIPGMSKKEENGKENGAPTKDGKDHEHSHRGSVRRNHPESQQKRWDVYRFKGIELEMVTKDREPHQGTLSTCETEYGPLVNQQVCEDGLCGATLTTIKQAAEVTVTTTTTTASSSPAEGCQIQGVDPGTKPSSNGFKAVGAQGDCNQRCQVETAFACQAFITTGPNGPCMLFGTLDRNISLLHYSKYYLQDLKCATQKDSIATCEYKKSGNIPIPSEENSTIFKGIGFAINWEQCQHLCQMNFPMFEKNPCTTFAYDPKQGFESGKDNCYFFDSDYPTNATSGELDFYQLVCG
ncbi:unnamed protein product, partial [Mesorhabditis spiculigera]